MILASCLICQEIFSAKEYLSVLSCGHIYHQKCINVWFCKKKTCPTCRSTQGNRKFVEKVFFNDIDNNYLLYQNEIFNETEALLNSKISKLQMENKELSDNFESSSTELAKLKEENKELLDKFDEAKKFQLDNLKDFDVIKSLNLNLSKELDNLRTDFLKLKQEKTGKEDQLMLYKKEIDKYKFLNSIVKDVSGDVSDKLNYIKDTNVENQIEFLTTALVVTQRNKVMIEADNTRLQVDLRSLKSKNQNLQLEIVKLRDNLSTIQNEGELNKFQLEELERQFRLRNINLTSYKIADISSVRQQETFTEENCQTSSTNDMSPTKQKPIISDEPRMIFPFANKDRPMRAFQNLSIMRKSFQNSNNTDQFSSNNEPKQLPSYINPLSKKFKNGININEWKSNISTNRQIIVLPKRIGQSKKRKSSNHNNQSCSKNQLSIKKFIKPS